MNIYAQRISSTTLDSSTAATQPARLSARIEQSQYYQSYSYGYPHKTAYRTLQSPTALRDAWQHEDRSRLHLYLHVPFCEMRCGFCNLFTTTHPSTAHVQQYIAALSREISAVDAALGEGYQFSRLTLGGGTPTFLQADELEQVFKQLSRLGIAPNAARASSVETSPLTATLERLQLLKAQKIQRISMGVQSFIDAEVHSIGRGQQQRSVIEAIERIRSVGFPTLNLDLIYGVADQTPRSWRYSLDMALSFEPDELFIYPLYVRPLTGIGRHGYNWADARLALYRIARERLLEAGYEQISMRYFRRPTAHAVDVLAYSCQQDSMVGLGCGARSYTRQLHYSSEYAVGRSSIKQILANYAQRSVEDFAMIRYGHRMSTDDQQRRFIIQSILHSSGLNNPDYYTRFGAWPLQHYPELQQLIDCELIDHNSPDCPPRGDHAADAASIWRLNARGFELSDLIGPWLYAQHINALTDEHQPQ